jgi:methionine synthase II (cobalamin-independent)
MDKITPATTIEEIVEEYAELVRPLREYGIKCIACGEPVWGTLKENARLKGIENIEEIVVELNKLIEETNHV